MPAMEARMRRGPVNVALACMAVEFSMRRQSPCCQSKETLFASTKAPTSASAARSSGERLAPSP